MVKNKRYSIILLRQKVVLYLFGLFLTSNLSVNAQQTLGFFGGVTVNFLQSQLADRSYTEIEPGIGFSLGASYECKLSKWLSIGARLMILKKGYNMSRTGNYNRIFESHRRSYLQLPLFVSCKKNIGNFRFGADLGGYMAYWISGKLKGNIPQIFSVITNVEDTILVETFPLASYNEKYEFSIKRDNRFELGGIVGIECSYPLYSRHFFFVHLDYYQAFTGDHKKNAINTAQAYNRTFNMYAGIKIDL